MDKHAPRPGVRRVASAGVVLALIACTPEFNWRDTQPEGSSVAMMFPCRPESEARKVAVGTSSLPIRLSFCGAGGATFSLAAIDVDDPARVTEMLAALRAQAVAKLSGAATEQAAWAPAGATPNPQSGRWRIVGRFSDGKPVVAEAAFFVKGLKLYQATILGNDQVPGRAAVDTFFGAIRLP